MSLRIDAVVQMPTRARTRRRSRRRGCKCRRGRSCPRACGGGVDTDSGVACLLVTKERAAHASSQLPYPSIPKAVCIPLSSQMALSFYAVVKHTKALPDRRPLTRGPLWFLPEWHPSPSHLPQVPSYQLRLAVRLHLLCIAGPMGPSAAHLVSPRPVSYGGRDSLSRRAEASSNKTGVLS